MMKQRGFTLIETIIFLVILAVIASTILISFNSVLQGSPSIINNSEATGYAEERMDLILGNRQNSGFSTTTDPCIATPALDVCSTGLYTITSTVLACSTANGCPSGFSSTAYKIVTVTATRSSGQPGISVIKALVADY